MDYVLAASAFALVFFRYLLGRLSADVTIGHFKRENERLNSELHKLTDRDERGRFKGSKK
jgi:hypothetical protein